MVKKSRHLHEPMPTLRAWREVNKLSRQQVVDRINASRPDVTPMTQATIGKWESGETAVTFAGMKILAEIYGTTADRLAFDPTDNITPDLMKQAYDILESKDRDAIRAWLKSGEFLPDVKK